METSSLVIYSVTQSREYENPSSEDGDSPAQPRKRRSTTTTRCYREVSSEEEEDEDDDEMDEAHPRNETAIRGSLPARKAAMEPELISMRGSTTSSSNAPPSSQWSLN